MHKLDSLADDLEMQIFERTRELEEERMKSELLLYSMMPEWVSFVNSSLSCLVLTIDNPHAYIIYTFAHIFLDRRLLDFSNIRSVRVAEKAEGGSIEFCRRRPEADIHKVGQKTGLFFRLDNLVTVSPRKACSMSKFSQFYREKGTKLAFQ